VDCHCRIVFVRLDCSTLAKHPSAAGLHTAANFVREMVLPLPISSATALTLVLHGDLSLQRRVLLFVTMIPLVAARMIVLDSLDISVVQ
jgi:hypothetical protein